jgi:pimeloyl-ACP methyl ester carboxylesterase
VPLGPVTIHRIDAGVLDVAYLGYGPADGWPCFLMHGFPYDVYAYAEAAPLLAAEGARVIVPWLRGYGPTRFLSPLTPRSGEQAALGADLLALMDALQISKATLAGFDWGGRACCILAALWPERVEALVTENGYNIQNIARAMEPAAPAHEVEYWYQYYFNMERGRRGLEKNREELCKLLWRMWSPTWKFTDDDYARSAEAFSNPDFVDVVVHSYRHRYGLAPGDPAAAEIDRRLAAQPDITVPTIAIDGDSDGVAGVYQHIMEKFSGPYRHIMVKGGGHNLPQENPRIWADAVLAARRMALQARE